jgi:hypothetical protein
VIGGAASGPMEKMVSEAATAGAANATNGVGATARA